MALDNRFRLFGAKIAFHRKLRNLSQLDLATAAEINEDYVSRIENARALGVSLAVCMRIADALEVPLSELTKE